MTKKKQYSILILLIIFLNSCAVFKPQIPPQTDAFTSTVPREFRAVWVATVANIDWPSTPGLPVEMQKQEALAILDTVLKLNMNAVIFQVRPHCDAFYKSNLEPWSYYLTGTQGQAPEPFYDPLKFWIEEAHKRGLELHAWFNPYRAHHPKGGEVSTVSVVKTKPELVKKLENGYYWLDPAKKETQDYSFNVVMDVLRRYDVDGIHFDDYFYPYPSYNNNKDFPDEDSWQTYQQAGGTLSRKDWRRNAVTSFIRRVYTAIKKEKPQVKFGLSPFGIYRPHHPESILGFDQFDVLYADARLWLNEGLVDYWTPQLYWPVNKIPQSFPVLLGWWTRENKKGRHVWPGLYAGKMKGTAGIDELINEIMISRGFVPEGAGQVSFSMKAFMDTSAALNMALLNGPYRKQALVPASPWLGKKNIAAPEVQSSLNKDTLFIKRSVSANDNLFKWIIYFQYGKEKKYHILNRSQNKFKIPLYLKEEKDENADKLIQVSVSAVNRSENESSRKVLYLEKNESNK